MNTFYQSILKIKNSVLIRDIMTKDVVCLKPSDLVRKAVIIMGDKRISTIVVTDKGALVGIVTERDMVNKIMILGKDPDQTKISDIMSTSPMSVMPDTTILQASNIMKREHIRKLIVLGSNNEVVGLLSQTDIINNLQKIDDSYRSLLGNPLLTVVIIAVVIILFLINIIVFKR